MSEDRKTRPGDASRAAASNEAARKDDRRLVQRLRESGDEDAREALIGRYLPLAQRLANRYRHTNEEMEDLRQVANMALVKAVDRFDAERGTAFSSFAVPTILGELKRHFRDHGWSVRVPRELQERAQKVGKTIEALSKEHGRPPSVGEVAERLGLSLEDSLEAMQAADAYEAVSLDGSPGGDEDAMAPIDGMGGVDMGYEMVEYGASIAGALKALSERDRVVLHLRFVDDLTQSEIARRVGVSQMQVSRLLRRAVGKLREQVFAEGEKREGDL